MDRVKRFLESKFGLTIGDIGPVALSLGVAVIIISVVALVLGTMTPQTYQASTVNNESIGNISSTGTIYTVSKASGTNFVELTDVTCYKDPGLSTKLGCEISDAEAGKINVTEADTDAGDEYSTYDYDEETTATSILGKGKDAMSTFGDWFNIIVIVAVAAIILGLVMLFRSSSRGGGV